MLNTDYKHDTYLLEEEQQQGPGRALQQEHRGLLADTLIQEEHTDQTP